MSEQIALTLLQFVGLALPAVAIMMSVVFEEDTPDSFEDQSAANYQNVRLAIAFLLIGGVIDLVYIFAVQQSLVLLLSGVAVGLAILHASWAVLFQKDALEADYPFYWAYQNTWRNLRSAVSSPMGASGEAKPADE